MIVEFLLPAILREATRNAFKDRHYPQSLVKEHFVEVIKGYSDLPDGLEEEFAQSFQIGILEPKLNRALSNASYAASVREITSASGNFTTDDIGRWWKFISTSGVVLGQGYIVDFPTSQTIKVDISGSGNATTGTLFIYEVQWVDRQTFPDISINGGTDFLTSNTSPPDDFTAEDVGKLVTVEYIGDILIKTLVNVYNSAAGVTLHKTSPQLIPTGSAVIYELATIDQIDAGFFTPGKVGLFSHYPHFGSFVAETTDILPRFSVRDKKLFVKNSNDADFADGTVLTIYGVTIPQVPVLETDEILVGEQFMDDCLAIATSILRGQRSLSSVGLDDDLVEKR